MRVVRVHTNEGQFTAVLGDPGRIYTPYVQVEFPVRKRRIPNGDVGLFTSQVTKGIDKKDYPVKRAANHLLRIGRQHGISKGARQFLNEARL